MEQLGKIFYSNFSIIKNFKLIHKLRENGRMKLGFWCITPHKITDSVNFSQIETDNKCSYNVLKTVLGTKHLKNVSNYSEYQ